MGNKGEIVIYRTPDHQTQIEVKFEEETVWLTQYQLVELFQASRSNLVEHIKNIYKDRELDEKSTCRKFRQIQLEGKRKVSRNIDHYNLDLIISVGYRVNSKRGTEFRQWATQRLKEHLVQGYTINQHRLAQLQQTIQLIHQTVSADELNLNEAKGLLNIINNYTQSFVLLNQFDSNNLTQERLSENITYEIEHNEAVNAIDELKKQLIKKNEASALFGNQKDKSFAGILTALFKLLMAVIYTQALKNRQLIYYTSL